MSRKHPDMTTGNPIPALISFILPMVLSQLLQQLYNMVDSIIIGRFLGEDAFAAVGASSALVMVFTAIATGSSIGCSVIIAKFYGAGEHARLKTAVRTATITLGLAGVAFAVIGVLFRIPLMRWLGTPENIFSMAVEYELIYFLGIPFLFLYNIISSEFNALGDSRTPLGLLLITSVLNVLLDLYAVASLGMGVDGVAIATVISQAVSVCLALPLLIRRLRRLPHEGTLPLFDPALLGKMLRVAVPSMIQQSIISVGMMLVQSTVNLFGSSVLAGYSAAIKIDHVALMPMTAIGNAMSTYAAQNLGAKKPERIGLGLRCANIFCIVMQLFTLLIIQFFAQDLISLFLSADSAPAAMATGVGYLKGLSWFYFVIGMKFSSDGVLRSVGEMGGFLAGNAINFGVRVLLARLLAPRFGIQMIWYVIPVCMGINYAISLRFYFRGKWRAREGLLKAEAGQSV